MVFRVVMMGATVVALTVMNAMIQLIKNKSYRYRNSGDRHMVPAAIERICV